VTLRRELERRQLLQLPRVHVSPLLGPETQRLREYVRRLQGNLAERAGGGGGQVAGSGSMQAACLVCVCWQCVARSTCCHRCQWSLIVAVDFQRW
jgi:hypothetical protein